MTKIKQSGARNGERNKYNKAPTKALMIIMIIGFNKVARFCFHK